MSAPSGLFTYFVFQIKHTRFCIRLRKKKCQLKRRFQINLQAFDKYVHSKGRYGLKIVLTITKNNIKMVSGYYLV